MRRLVTLVVVLLAAIGGVVAAATGSSSSSPSAAPAPVVEQRGALAMTHHGVTGHRGMARMALALVTRSLAERMGVDARELRRAGRPVVRRGMREVARAAGVTATERRALRACKRRAACDRTALRGVRRKLHASLPTVDLAALRDRLAGDLGRRLGIPAAKVLEALRAELEQRLGQATAMGLLSARGRELALACWDAPAACDHTALHGEVRLPRALKLLRRLHD